MDIYQSGQNHPTRRLIVPHCDVSTLNCEWDHILNEFDL